VVFGTCGPVLVLFHSTFQTRSLNATVAFWSMIVVVISGIIGRFVYIHMYQGLEGGQATLKNVEQHLEDQAKQAQHVLGLVPRVRESLEQYRHHVFNTRTFTWRNASSFLAIGWNGERLISRSIKEIERAVLSHAMRNNWPRSKRLAEVKMASELIEDYVRAIDTTARYAYWERMLAGWHMIHIPLVYLLLATAIAHVVAVHMY
jgi:hypothetical protein